MNSYKIIKKNLFKVNSKYALAHCISKDIQLEKGIAHSFDILFPQMSIYLKQNRNYQIPQVILYKTKDQIIFNLITKNKYYEKPNRHDFNLSLEMLFKNLQQLDIHYLAIPMIGSGLDRLNWKTTEKYLIQLSKEFDVNLVVCKL